MQTPSLVLKTETSYLCELSAMDARQHPLSRRQKRSGILFGWYAMHRLYPHGSAIQKKHEINPPLRFDSPLPNVCFPFFNRFLIEHWTLWGVVFFGFNDLNANELRLIEKHLNPTGVRHLDNVLIVSLPHIGFLFPVGIFTDNQRSDAFRNQRIDHSFRRCM